MSVPAPLQEIVDEFRAAPSALRLPLLLEYANKLPPLPPRLQGARDLFEQVEECQTPLFVTTEVRDGTVSVWFDAPPEAPTTRGFASILAHGLDGRPVEEVLAVPDDVHDAFGLATLVSPLRLRGLQAMLARLKGQVRRVRAEA